MRKRLKYIIALAIAATLVVAGAFVMAERQAVWGHTDGLSDEQIVAKLSSMSKANFMKDLNAAFNENEKSATPVTLSPWIITASERFLDYTDDEIMDQIENTEHNETLRYYWVELLSHKHPKRSFNHPRILAMLADPAFPDSIKRSLIVSFNYEAPEAKKILAEVALNATDPGLLFNAIKYLDKADPDMAYDMASGILKDYKNQSDGSIKGAIRVISNKLERGTIRTNSAEKADLLSICSAILGASDNADLKDSIVGLLMLIGDYDALQMIVHNLGVDNIMRAGIIDGNYYVLEQVLQARPAKEDVIFAVQCMGILPIKDLYEPLKTAIAALPAAFSADESREFADVLQKMMDEGVPAKTELKK